MDKGRELVKEILLPILPRYESQGLFDFEISYIILPDGSIDEVSFHFCSFDGKLDITEEEMVVWQRLSDALKQNIKFDMCDAPKVQFGRSGLGIILPNLLNPEPPAVQNSDTVKKKVYPVRLLTPEEAEKLREINSKSKVVKTFKDFKNE